MGSGMDALVSAFANDSSGNLYAAGPLTVGSNWKASVARWDGDRWVSLHSDTLFGFYPYAVVCDAKGSPYVGGKFKSIEGVPANNIAKWDGSEWSAVGSGVKSAANIPHAWPAAICIPPQAIRLKTASAKTPLRATG